MLRNSVLLLWPRWSCTPMVLKSKHLLLKANQILSLHLNHKSCSFCFSIAFSLALLSYRLIEECWSENPARRPTFRQIIPRLETIHSRLDRRSCWKVLPFPCCMLIFFVSHIYYFDFHGCGGYAGDTVGLFSAFWLDGTRSWFEQPDRFIEICRERLARYS